MTLPLSIDRVPEVNTIHLAGQFFLYKHLHVRPLLLIFHIIKAIHAYDKTERGADKGSRNVEAQEKEDRRQLFM